METDVLPVVRPADWVPGPPQGQWTYDDYATLPDDGQRYEIIEGVLYMTPAPNLAHQNCVGNFFYYLRQYIALVGLGRVFVAPTDVGLAPKVVVQPDVVVVLAANLSILTPSRIYGTPDLVVEVASPSTTGYDRRQKQDAYARAGMPEYWLADPVGQTVEVLRLPEGGYASLGVFRGKATLPTQVVPHFPVAVEQFFVEA